ncbi:MAG TPA: hypothetical protein VI855_03210 [Dehalococcoidia bacterium]|nr:hypothetical protein [Dehalococcoidia bacterium]
MRAAPFLAWLALLLASLGPVLDHHFAERQPGHTHLYVGAQVPGHQHPYQQAHVHTHELLAAGQSPANPSSWPSEVVYLTNYEGIGVGLAALTGPVLHASLAFPDSGDGPLLRADAAPDAWPEAAVTPLERPPLA